MPRLQISLDAEHVQAIHKAVERRPDSPGAVTPRATDAAVAEAIVNGETVDQTFQPGDWITWSSESYASCVRSVDGPLLYTHPGYTVSLSRQGRGDHRRGTNVSASDARKLRPAELRALDVEAPEPLSVPSILRARITGNDWIDNVSPNPIEHPLWVTWGSGEHAHLLLDVKTGDDRALVVSGSGVDIARPRLLTSPTPETLDVTDHCRLLTPGEVKFITGQLLSESTEAILSARAPAAPEPEPEATDDDATMAVA